MAPHGSPLTSPERSAPHLLGEECSLGVAPKCSEIIVFTTRAILTCAKFMLRLQPNI
jgi:hypothetical protein